MRTFYYANQFVHRLKALAIQKDLEFYHGLHLINPFYDNQRDDITVCDALKDAGKQDYPRYSDEKCLDVVLSDLQEISCSDGIVCILYDRVVLGSFMELFYASYVLKLPVYLICYDESIREHLWIRALCWKIFPDIESFKEYVVDNPKEMK